MSAAALAKWILDEGYAVQEGGLLVPTERVGELAWAGLLVPVEDASLTA